MIDIYSRDGKRLSGEKQNPTGGTGLLDGTWMVCLADIFRGGEHIQAVLSRCDEDGNIFLGGDVIEFSDGWVTASVPDEEGNPFTQERTTDRVECDVTDYMPGYIGKGETVTKDQWQIDGFSEFCVGDIIRINESLSRGSIRSRDKNSFSVAEGVQRMFSLEKCNSDHLTNDKGEEVTEENYDEWANSFIEKVYNPFLEKIGL